MNMRIGILSVVFWGLFTVATVAQDIEAKVTLVSDYRDRGVSQSAGDPALQAQIDIWFENGFSLGAWGSSTRGKSGVMIPGGDAEFNIYGAYNGTMGAVGFWSAGAQFVTFADGDDSRYGEFFSSVGVDYGFAVASLNLTYAPDRDDIDAGDNIYVQAGIDAQLPGKPYGARLSVGYDEFSRIEDKWDWKVGAFYQLGSATLSVDYIDTNKSGRDRNATVVGSLSFAF